MAIEQGLEHLRERVRRFCLRVEEPAETASVCIVRNPAEVPRRMAWVLTLYGGAAVNPAFVQSMGKKGELLQFEAAVRKAKLGIWLTPAFVAEAPRIAAMLRRAVSHPGSKWQLQAHENSFWSIRGKAVAIAAPSDRGLIQRLKGRCAGTRKQKTVMSAQGFLKSQTKVILKACKLRC